MDQKSMKKAMEEEEELELLHEDFTALNKKMKQILSMMENFLNGSQKSKVDTDRVHDSIQENGNQIPTGKSSSTIPSRSIIDVNGIVDDCDVGDDVIYEEVLAMANKSGEEAVTKIEGLQPIEEIHRSELMEEPHHVFDKMPEKDFTQEKPQFFQKVIEKKVLEEGILLKKVSTDPIGRVVADHNVGKDLPFGSVGRFEKFPGGSLFATILSIELRFRVEKPLRASNGFVGYKTSLFNSNGESRRISEAFVTSSCGGDFVCVALLVNILGIPLCVAKARPTPLPPPEPPPFHPL